jgi:hypothetical protein
MSFLDRIRFDDDQDSRVDRFGDLAGRVLDIAFDDWGGFLIFWVIALVFLAVSGLGYLCLARISRA